MDDPYDMALIPERARAAMAALGGHVAERLASYEARRARRARLGLPTLAVLGMGRAGKDTAAMYLGATTPLAYGGSSSNGLCRFVAHMTGLPEAQAWAERHRHRDYWIAAGHAVRGCDLTLLCRLALADGDMAVGLRGRHELYGCLRDGVVDLALWVDNDRVPPDPTVEFGPDDCDLLVPNRGAVTELYRRLDRFARACGLGRAAAPEKGEA